MISSTLSGNRPTQPKMWPPFAADAAAFMIMGTVVLTSQWAVRQNTTTQERGIQGLTIEKQPYAEDHGLPDLIVTSVKSSGMTHDTGVEVGDVIEAVGGQPVVSKAQLEDAAEASNVPLIRVTVLRSGKRMTFDLPARAKTAN